MSTTLAIILGLLLHASGGPPTQTMQSDVTRSCVKATFTLETEKSLYRVGESIAVRYVLENRGSCSFYLNPAIAPVGGWDAGVRIALYDRDNREVRGAVVGHTLIPDYESMNLTEYIPTRWILMSPGAFYGMHTRYSSGCTPAPGKYKLVATYFSNILTKLKPVQKDSLKELPYSIFADNIRSNEAWIEIAGNAGQPGVETCNAAQ